MYAHHRPFFHIMIAAALIGLSGFVGTHGAALAAVHGQPPHPSVVDISGETNRHVIIAKGTETDWQGHPHTVLLPDGKTMFCVWQGRQDGTGRHGAPGGLLKRSDDGGLTWTGLLDVPANWKEIGRGSPAIHRLVDAKEVARLFVYCRDEKRTTLPPGSGAMKTSSRARKAAISSSCCTATRAAITPIRDWKCCPTAPSSPLLTSSIALARSCTPSSAWASSSTRTTRWRSRRRNDRRGSERELHRKCLQPRKPSPHQLREASNEDINQENLATGSRRALDGSDVRRGWATAHPPERRSWTILRVQDRTASDSPTAFHYPCAIEHGGRLLVLYTTGRTIPRQCELAIIPIASLQLKDR